MVMPLVFESSQAKGNKSALFLRNKADLVPLAYEDGPEQDQVPPSELFLKRVIPVVSSSI